MTAPSPWWTPHVHADRRPRLLARNAIAADIRAWFAARDFVEVDTAILQVSPGNEAHLSAFSTEAIATGGERRPLHLHTSPEFTMVEWYRVGEPYETLMDDCAAFLALAAARTGASRFSFRGREADPFAPPERLTVRDAFARHAGIDLMASIRPDGSTDRDILHAAVSAAGIRTAPDDNWADLVSRVMVEKVEPNLGVGAATVLCEYPTAEAALARPTAHDPRVAERFELYCCGVELANGFGELTDAAEQRRRFEAEMDEKQRIYGERYPLDEDFLAALAIMPDASGVALGFDRLVLLATGARHIDDIIWTPVADG